MDKQLLTGEKNVVVQGITGKQGLFHTQAMLAAGTAIIGGTSPSKAGSVVFDVPVYKTLAEIPEKIDISIIFVPAAHTKAAIIEAVNASVPLIICITEGIPIHDMLYIKQHMKGKSSRLIGPNSPGILLPSISRQGIIPHTMGRPGSIGVVSRSGTLTYEAMSGLSERGLGQKYVIGIGGDPIKGTGFVDCLALFEQDPDITSIVMIGEIGGTEEIEAAKFIQKHVSKPVYGYIAGHHAPAGIQLGHAGAILGSDRESATVKSQIMHDLGIVMSTSIVELVESVVA